MNARNVDGPASAAGVEVAVALVDGADSPAGADDGRTSLSEATDEDETSN